MSLLNPPDKRAFRGEASDREHMVNVRFVELALNAGKVPPSRENDLRRTGALTHQALARLVPPLPRCGRGALRLRV
jgi:hypothetical protein